MTNTQQTIIEAENSGMWDEAVRRCAPQDDIFFRNGYYRLYHIEARQPEAFYFQEGQEIFFFPYLKRPIEATEYFDFETAYGYSGPAANTESRDFLAKAWSVFFQYCLSQKVIAGFIRFNPYLQNHRLADHAALSVRRECDVVTLTLTGKTMDDIWQDYEESNQNKIRRAEKVSFAVTISSGVESLGVFREIYHQALRQLAADDFYYFDENYFKSLAENFPQGYQVLIGSYEGRPIGGALVLLHDKVLYYFLSGVIEEGRKGGLANLLRHHAIVWAHQHGIAYINFGGGKTSDPQDSLLKFKKGFSKEVSDFYVGKFLVDEKVYNRLCEQWENTAPREVVKKYQHYFLSHILLS